MSRSRSIQITIGFTVLVCFILVRTFSWVGFDGKGYTAVVEGDGIGYYMYLPAVFINHNFSGQVPDQRYIFKTENGAVNKYYSGTAVAMLPFFTIGYLQASATEQSTDGYSPPFQKAISIAGLFYLGLGLFFFARLLKVYKIKSGIICIVLVTVVFGTNLLIYSVYHPSHSHIYSFCFISLFLYYGKRYINTPESRYLCIASALLGLIVIIRPTNGLILLILPFLAGSAAMFKTVVQRLMGIKQLTMLLGIFSFVLSIQLLLVYLQTGEIILWSYSGEGFYFLHPQVFNVLFSFRKGLFIYTPLIAICLFGLIAIYRASRFQFYAASVFLIMLVYITSSWWCWYYGPSFGQRPFVDFYALFALLFALFLNSLDGQMSKLAAYTAVLACVFLNLIQSYQYEKHILSAWNMTFEKYRYVFLRTSSDYYSVLGGCDDIRPYSESESLLADISVDFENENYWWKAAKLKRFPDEHHNVSNYSESEFNGVMSINAGKALTGHRILFAELELEKLEEKASGKNGPLLVISETDSAGETYHYYAFHVNEVPSDRMNEWQKFRYTVEIPSLRSSSDKLNFYVWNKNLQAFSIDNVKLRITGID